jgi:hypothetical protein
MKRKALKFGTCHVCRKVDGWGLSMIDSQNSRVTICKACHGPGCPECGRLFSRDNPATEYIIFGPDGDPEESEVRCAQCAERPDGP